MKSVNMHEAKSNLSKLVHDAVAGEVVVIAKAGVPMVRLVPVTPGGVARRPGALKGKIRILGDIVSPDPQDADLFSGGSAYPASQRRSSTTRTR